METICTAGTLFTHQLQPWDLNLFPWTPPPRCGACWEVQVRWTLDVSRGGRNTFWSADATFLWCAAATQNLTPAGQSDSLEKVQTSGAHAPGGLLWRRCACQFTEEEAASAHPDSEESECSEVVLVERRLVLRLRETSQELWRSNSWSLRRTNLFFHQSAKVLPFEFLHLFWFYHQVFLSFLCRDKFCVHSCEVLLDDSRTWWEH